MHLAIAVSDVQASVREYTSYLGVEPVLVLEDYALWRTDVLNLSVRRTDQQPGMVRHVGFEDAEATEFSEYVDRDGLVWERFSAREQEREIKSLWPRTDYTAI